MTTALFYKSSHRIEHRIGWLFPKLRLGALKVPHKAVTLFHNMQPLVGLVAPDNIQRCREVGALFLAHQQRSVSAAQQPVCPR